MRCDCCQKRAMHLWFVKEPGMNYFSNGEPESCGTVVACSPACATEASFGPRRRVPAGATLCQGPRLYR